MEKIINCNANYGLLHGLLGLHGRDLELDVCAGSVRGSACHVCLPLEINLSGSCLSLFSARLLG